MKRTTASMASMTLALLAGCQTAWIDGPAFATFKVTFDS